MSLTIDLPNDLERELSAAAAREGVATSEFALRLLWAAVLATSLRSGAELVAYWQSGRLIGTRSDIADSQKHARELREAAEQERGVAHTA